MNERQLTAGFFSKAARPLSARKSNGLPVSKPSGRDTDIGTISAAFWQEQVRLNLPR